MLICPLTTWRCSLYMLLFIYSVKWGNKSVLLYCETCIFNTFYSIVYVGFDRVSYQFLKQNNDFLSDSHWLECIVTACLAQIKMAPTTTIQLFCKSPLRVFEHSTTEWVKPQTCQFQQQAGQSQWAHGKTMNNTACFTSVAWVNDSFPDSISISGLH